MNEGLIAILIFVFFIAFYTVTAVLVNQRQKVTAPKPRYTVNG